MQILKKQAVSDFGHFLEAIMVFETFVRFLILQEVNIVVQGISIYMEVSMSC